MPFELRTSPSATNVVLKRTGEPDVHGKVYRAYGLTFVQMDNRLYVLSPSESYLYCCQPWEPYTQLPASGWHQIIN